MTDDEQTSDVQEQEVTFNVARKIMFPTWFFDVAKMSDGNYMLTIIIPAAGEVMEFPMIPETALKISEALRGGIVIPQNGEVPPNMR